MNDRKNRIRPASLNHTYRLVWSEKSQSFVAVAEITPGRGKAGRTVTGAVAGLMLLASSAAWAVDPGALPDGESLTHGDATFTRDGDELIIEQGSERIITEWERFNIGEDAGVRFDQPGSDSAALNRILDENPSQILGRLEANGQIFLTNPAGITFGEGAQVNVGSLVASTLEISDEDFLDGRLNFENRGSSDGRIKNRGEIEAAGGVVALIANEVSNQGEIRNDGGDVALAAGDEVTLDFDGDGLTTVTVERGVLDALVENGELIRADGGQVVMTTQAKNAIYRNLVNNEGTVRARTLEEGEDGRIMLSGGMEEGEVRAGGTLDASAPDGGDGGRIETSAAQVDIDPDIEVTTHAEQGQTGEWVIDPTDVYIVEGDEDGDQLDDDELAEGVTTVHNNTLESALETTSVTIETPEEGGEGAGDIFVNADVAWSENTLTLSAYRDIEINRHLDASAGGHLTLEYAQGDAEGDYRVNMAGGYVDTTDEGRDYAGRISLDGASTFRTRYADDAEIEHNVITDASELDAVRDELDADHVLGGDVDLDGFSENAGWEPVGDDDSPFTGGFDGLGNSIGNLTIDRPDEDEVGLFGHAENASFRHVNLEGVDLTGADYVGALVGLWRNTGDVDLEGIRVTGNITSSDQGSYVGAVFGSARIEDATLTIDRVRIVDTAVENAQEEDNFRAGSYTGGMGGKLEADGSEARLLMSNVLVSGDVTGANGDAGGVTGRLNINGGAEAEFEDLNTSVTLESRTLAGGLFGWYAARSGSQLAISGVHASGDITVEDDQGGGLVGTLQLPDDGEFTLEQAYFSGSVSGGDDLGGLVGVWHEGESPDHVMRDVYVIGDISGDERVGGLIGATSPYSAIPYRLDVQNAYATGTVKGSSHVGGLVGQLTDRDTASIQLTNAFAANTVTGDSYAGGLVGKVEEGVEFHTTHAFYDYETNTDDAMLDADVYGASRVEIRGALEGEGGWTVEDEANATDIEGYGLGLLPYLSDVTIPEDVNELPMATLFEGGWGDAEGDGAYTVARADQLQNINQVADRTFDFELVDDVDLPAEGDWTPIGDENAPFNGQLDGQGYAVRHLTLDDASRNAAGLFGAVADARLMNLRVEGAAIEAGDRVGALAGVAEGDTRIEDVFASGSVAGGDDVGGLVGVARGSTDLERVHATTEVTGDGNTGGLLGRAADEVSIRDAYASNTVNGGTHTGGVAGATGGDVVVDNVFYDAETNAGEMADDHRGVSRQAIRRALEDVGGWEGQDYDGDGAEWEGYRAGPLPSLSAVDDDDYAMSLPMATLFGGGFGGTEHGDQTAYEIARTDHLRNIHEVVGDGYAFELVNDLDLADEANWDPIGDSDAPFVGQFDGQGYAIRNLTIDRPDPDDLDAGGLFGVALNAILRDLVLEDVDVVGGGRVGALVGRAVARDGGTMTISDVDVSGEVRGEEMVGGLAGETRAIKGDTEGASVELANLEADVDVAGSDSRVGGLVGAASAAGGAELEVRTASARGQVTADSWGAGGLVGSLEADESGILRVIEVEAFGQVSAPALSGGLVGFSEASNGGSLSITHVVAEGDVSGQSDIGGLVGYGSADGDANLKIEHASALGEVTGDDWIGGLAGYIGGGDIEHGDAQGDVILDSGDAMESNGGLVGWVEDSTIRWSHATGAVSSEIVSGGETVATGGLVGQANNTLVEHSYANGPVTAGASAIAGGLIGTATDTTLTEVYATGSVEAGDDAIAGGLLGVMEDSGIDRAYATGAVTVGDGTDAHAGGFVGRLAGGGAVSEAYSAGRVEAGEEAGIGGFAGDEAGDGNDVEHSYWDTDASGVTEDEDGSGIATGRSTEALQDRDTFTEWSLSSEAGDDTAWRLYDGAARPLLRAFFKDEAVIEFTPEEGQGREYDGSVVVELGDETPWSVAEGVDEGLISVEALELILAGADAGEQDVQRIVGVASSQQGYDLDIQGPGQYRVDPRSVTLSGDFSVEDREYDGTTEAVLAETGGLALENLVDGEDLELTALAAAFADADAGETITVSLIEAELADGDEGLASNYTLLTTDWPTTTATIDPRTLTLGGEFSAEDKVYDGTDVATIDTTELSLNNLVEDEALNLEGLAAAFEQSDVGENLAVSLTGEGLADGEGGSADNYTL
ncbi:filamentous hemagglutinin family protein, partial [Thioalkalivibrio sp. ALE21]|uniref:two-partner secretion domain-containing protein n=1 Tax=Thioalkalivibrio sp. ALE21 TaxID=1158175 RepID=UPI000D9B3132